ncbi:MAG: DUF3604 domain-containing protein [Novosphingobium sp.]|nr:DUF3604 domain-containing protein [Novosphingobium sp.]
MKAKLAMLTGVATLATVLAILGSGVTGAPVRHARAVAPLPIPSGGPETRRALFGELHLHTGYSFDAYALMGSRTEPETAYRFGEGRPVLYEGQTVQRPRPLDFMAVTDHSEFLGTFMQAAANPNGALARSDIGKLMLTDPLRIALGGAVDLLARPDTKALVGQAMQSAWSNLVATANRHYRPGVFTTFVAYEWTSMKDRKWNLHRNVIFRGAPPPMPFSAADSDRPEDLWSYLERMRGQGIEALAIPHNANASGGLMFDWNDSNGRPIDEAYAQRRAFNEPLSEAFQHKGQSETSPLLSPTDEFADFERAEESLVGGPSPVNGSFIRQALGRGIVLQSRLGTNPWKLGFVGSSDFHNGLSNADENAYAGNGLSSTDPRVNLPDREFARRILSQDPHASVNPATQNRTRTREELLHTPAKLNWSSGGLTGVWAEANTREAIYAALRRKETFATSGPELRIRFFGGWGFAPDAMRRAGWVASAYRTGTPMGGDLVAPTAPGRAPTFLFEAAKDPMSGNLDRIQVVKLWREGGDYKEKVFDVAWSPGRRRDPVTGRLAPVGNTVNLGTATYANTIGAPTLAGFWRDSEFDPAKPAVYYARVLEIPTPRWTTRLAAARQLPRPVGVPATIQERAISSPIWYSPRR